MRTEKMIAQREAYGAGLVELGKANPKVAVLDADVSNSTRTLYFAKEFPERFFNFGIAEQNMMAAAAGMAKCGLIPFVNTFSFLATYRAADQLRTSIAYTKANVKIAATYGGLSDSFDGPTHQSVADLAMVRALPDLTVVVPADAVEVEKALPVLAEFNGPVWLRLSRNPSPVIYGDDYQFTLGKATLLREGTDLTLISCGTVLGRVLDAADLLAKEGLSPRVVSIATLKPIDKEAILAAARETGAIVTVEEHSILGGLGAAVSEIVTDQHPCPVKRVGIPDTFADTGPYEELLDMFGLSVDNIVKAAKDALAMKKANS
ncbi:MAG: transketolase family protein [Firmicutes bacterium]|nr:transketolase family protein [Bacillota bacterium]